MFGVELTMKLNVKHDQNQDGEYKAVTGDPLE